MYSTPFPSTMPLLLSTPSYTGNSAFRLPAPNFSKPAAIHGPTTGTLPTNPAIVAKKSPNNTSMPYISIRKPKKGQRMRMSRMPRMKARVPFHFWRRAKKVRVFWKPIMHVRPIRKRICVGRGLVGGRGRWREGLRCPLPTCVHTLALYLQYVTGREGGRSPTSRDQKTSRRHPTERTRLNNMINYSLPSRLIALWMRTYPLSRRRPQSLLSPLAHIPALSYAHTHVLWVSVSHMVGILECWLCRMRAVRLYVRRLVRARADRGRVRYRRTLLPRGLS